jgi:hypothetical protein
LSIFSKFWAFFSSSRLASPLVVATQGCFATDGGDAGVLRHWWWRRRGASPLTVATQLRLPRCLWRSCRLCLATGSGDAQLPRHSIWRRRPGAWNKLKTNILARNHGQNQYTSSKSYWTSSKSISEHNIIYEIRAHDHIRTSSS